MPSYEIIYFPFAGRAYITRLMLSIADIPYKNVFPEWPAEKTNMPFHRLPVLKELSTSGATFALSESTVIERYIARKYGFMPTDHHESALVDQYVTQMYDTIEAFANHFYHIKTEESKQKLIEALTFLIEKHEPVLSKSTSGYYVGDSLTLADIYMFTLFGLILNAEDKDVDVFSKNQVPAILRLVQLIRQKNGVANVRNDAE